MKMKKSTRSFFFLVGAILVAAVLVVMSIPAVRTESVPLSQFINEAKTSQIDSIDVEGNKLTATLKDPTAPKHVTNKESTATLKDYGIDDPKITVRVKGADSGTNSIWFQLLITVGPIALIIAFFYFMMRQA